MKNQANARVTSWASRNSTTHAENTPIARGRLASVNRGALTDASTGSSKTLLANSPCLKTQSQTPSPRKENIKGGSLSPISRKEVIVASPRSSI